MMGFYVVLVHLAISVYIYKGVLGGAAPVASHLEGIAQHIARQLNVWQYDAHEY